MAKLKKDIIKPILRGNAAFGFGSILLGVIGSILQKYVNCRYEWLNWIIIIVSLIAIAFVLIAFGYLIDLKHKIDISNRDININNLSNIFIECDNLIKKIDNIRSESENNLKQLYLFKLVNNLSACFAFYNRKKTISDYALFINLFDEYVEYAKRYESKMCAETRNMLCSIELRKIK